MKTLHGIVGVLFVAVGVGCCHCDDVRPSEYDEYARKISRIEADIQRMRIAWLYLKCQKLQDLIYVQTDIEPKSVQFDPGNPKMGELDRAMLAAIGEGYTLLEHLAGLTDAKSRTALSSDEYNRLIAGAYAKIFPGRDFRFSPISADYLNPDFP